MTKRYAPPGRKSSSQPGSVKPFGPHQRARCLGSLQVSKTRRRGAAKTRVTIILPPAGAALLVTALLFATISLLLALQFLEVAVQLVEALFPVAPVVLDPVGDVLERIRLEPAGPPLRLAAALDQARALEDLQVLGNGGQGPVGGVRPVSGRGIAP